MSERVDSLPVPLLVQYVDLPTLLPYLRTRNLVTSDEYLQLSKKWTDGYRQQAAMELVTAVLPRKGPTWERGLVEALEASVQPECEDVHAGHEYILQCLETDGRGGVDWEQVSRPIQEVCLQKSRVRNSCT